MGNLTHNICVSCWDRKNPGEQATRVLESAEETCCYCGTATKAGIYVRDTPTNTNCIVARVPIPE